MQTLKNNTRYAQLVQERASAGRGRPSAGFGRPARVESFVGILTI